MSELKHYNSGNVWGRVSAVKEEKSDGGKPYLSITVECPNEMYGNIKTYGRLWGRDKIDAFLDHYKKNPGASYRLQGFLSQYTKNDIRYNNYTFFSWQQVSDMEFRAAFILVGEVTAVEKLPTEGKVCMHLHRENTGDRDDINEDFEIYTLNAQAVDGIQTGMLVEAKGLLRYKEPGDFFGGAPEGSVKPYVMQIKVREAF